MTPTTARHPRAWRSAQGLICVVLAIVAVAACSSAGTTDADTEQRTTSVASHIADAAAAVVDAEYVGEGPTVAVIGDSITAESRDAIRDALSAFRVRIASRIGGTIATLGPTAEEYAATTPDVVVVNLGTNDVWWQLPVESAATDFQAIVDMFPESCTVAVTVTEHGDPGWKPFRPIYNRALATQFNTTIRPRADRVADWEAAIAPDPARYTKADLIHPTEEGQQLLARLIEDAVSECPG